MSYSHKIMNVPKVFKSSANPENISLTIKGIGVGLIPLIIIIAGAFSVQISQSELLNIVEVIAGVVAGLMIIYGFIRKIIISIKKNK